MGPSMSVNLTETNYRIVRNNDPTFQAMSRVADTNNIYDIYQEYVKSGSNRNDFKSQLKLFDYNKGVLNDGKYVDMSNFFMESHEQPDGSVLSTAIPYFKFKTNSILRFKNPTKMQSTYVTRSKKESIYELRTISDGISGETIRVLPDSKTNRDVTYNSFPLQRVDKLAMYEMDSLFVYIDGKKIPDNEIFVYTNKSFTDVFIPEKYIPGDIHDESSTINTVIHIDYRQPGSEEFYWRSKINDGSRSLTIDLKEPKYNYRTEFSKEYSTDKLLIFYNGELRRPESSSLSEDNVLTINFSDPIYSADVEIYILNDIIYRYIKPDSSNLNVLGSSVHFYIPDNYFADVVSGPIPKPAVSFFYKGKRMNDSKIIQTSRFSFEYILDKEEYRQVTVIRGMTPVKDEVYYTKNLDNEYIRLGYIDEFDPNVIYFLKNASEPFDETKVDFIIEDINSKVDDPKYTMYGDDYYLLNMLGVERSVDKMKGGLSYSIFDDPTYDLGFKEILSKNGKLFDIPSAVERFDNISKNTRSPKERLLELIRERPTLIRRLFEQFKHKSKRILVVGNLNDVKLSSVYKLNDSIESAFYKIYLNHYIVDNKYVTVTRENDHDNITIDKSALLDGPNVIELFQFDLSYKAKLAYRDNVKTGGFTYYLNDNNEKIYRKTYDIDDLPFDKGLLKDDITAIEKVAKGWYDQRSEEYYYVYPGPEQYGWRTPKYFKVVSKTDTEITIDIKLFEEANDTTGGYFYLLAKQYNVAETISIDNEDGSYMDENDLLIPVYSSITNYKYDDSGEKVIDCIDKYIPYINNSEPIITIDSREQIFGKDYTFYNPEKNIHVTTSYVILKKQPKKGSNIIVQFNSNKTNILVVGYDDLEIDNRYGLVYLSELRYPVSPEYMNIFVNGAKMSIRDMDILSDKLVRFHNINRPIRSILITTNSEYKDSELQEFIDLYKPSKFEKVLEDIFWNCDPSKTRDPLKPSVDMVYKVNPYYSEFVGDAEEKYQNQYYAEYVKTIKDNRKKYDERSIFRDIFPSPDPLENEYDLRLDAYNNAEKFFNIYKINHGFVEDVDSLKQKENTYFEEESINFVTDTLEIMYLNWLSNSGKTRTYGFKTENIDPMVLNYFSVFENIILNNRIDIVIDSSRFYDGLYPDVSNPPFEVNPLTGEKRIIYPGVNMDSRRALFFEMLLQFLESRKDSESGWYNGDTGEDLMMENIYNNKLSNILYPSDFPLTPDENGIRETGTNVDIVNYTTPDSENQALKDAIRAAEALGVAPPSL